MWPAWWMWLVAWMFALSIGVAFGAAIPGPIGWLAFISSLSLAVLGLIRGATRIHVDDRVFRAGRARLPLEHVGRVAPLDAEKSRLARGPEADTSGYYALRTIATNLSVLVEVTDPRDPHGTWLVSTRHPDELARAIAQGRDAARGRTASGTSG